MEKTENSVQRKNKQNNIDDDMVNAVLKWRSQN